MKLLSLGIQTRSLEIMLSVLGVGQEGKGGCKQLLLPLQSFAPVIDQQQQSRQREVAVTFVGFCSVVSHSILFWVFFYGVQHSSIFLQWVGQRDYYLSHVVCCIRFNPQSYPDHTTKLSLPPSKGFVLGTFRVMYSNVKLCPCGKSQKIPSG